LVAGNSGGPIAAALQPIAFLAVLALPISIGVGILKYRIFEIDRLVSRTLSYTIVTGLVVGLYVGIVTLTTKTLGFYSPVAVAASTWPRPPYSTRSDTGFSVSSIVGSTEPATTLRRPLRVSRLVFAMRSIWRR